MHLIHLRPIMLIIIIALTCAWLGQWYCALRLCAYDGWSKKQGKVSFDDWMVLPHIALLMTLPGMAIMVFVPSLLRETGIISASEVIVLRSLLFDFLLTTILFIIAPAVVKAIYLLFSDDKPWEVTSEVIDPFDGRLDVDETVLWHGNPVQPYFRNKGLQPFGYVLGFFGLVEIPLAFQITTPWKTHDFYHMYIFLIMMSVPFMAFVLFRTIKKDYSRDMHYYVVTDQRLLKAEFVNKGVFNRSSLRYDFMDISKTVKSPEKAGINNLNYKSTRGDLLYRVKNQIGGLKDTHISFRCIKDADTVDALVRVAYEESQKRGCYDAV